MFELPEHVKAQLRAEVNLERVVDLLRRNRDQLAHSELTVNVARTNLRKNTDEDETARLRTVLRACCEIWFHDWMKRKQLLFLFCQVDEEMRRTRNYFAGFSPNR